MTNSTKKVVAAVVGFGLALSVFAGASTASAQAAMSLSDLVNLFIQLGIIAPDKAAAAKAAVTSSASVSFTKDLTVGSSGAEVTALQNALGVSPATGYFGSVTKAAVQKYQTSKGLPSTGFVGPLTRAELNKTAGTTTGGTTTGGSTTGTTPVVNSGVEGTLTVDKTSISNSTVYEGESMKSILGIELEAKLSDINIQRVKLDLGADTSVYTKVFRTLYLTDDSGRVLAQADLNSNTVVKDSGRYYLTLGGFSYNVPRNATKYVWVKADLYSSIKSTDFGNPRTITLPADGVRGIDGAGIDQYGPVSSFSQALTISTSLSDSATLDASVNSANFKAADVVAAQGSNNDELDKLPLLAFDLRANKADLEVTDLTITLTNDQPTHATTTTVYLYDGATLIQSESVTSGNQVVFDDIDNLVIAKDTTKTLTVKADIREADSTATSISAQVTSITAENLQGTGITESGTPAGETMVVRSIGPVFSLVGTPTMTRTTVSSNDTSGVATSTGSANFTVNITAVGGDIKFGSSASSTTLFGAMTTATTSGNYLSVYKNGAAAGALSANTAAGTNAIVSYSVPSSGVTTADSGASFVLAKNNSVQVPVTVQFTVAGNAANQYAVQINGFRWFNSTVGYADSQSMTNKTEWRTPTVSLP